MWLNYKPMDNSYYIHNALIVNENSIFPGAVLIHDGVIAEVFKGKAPDGMVMPDDTTIINAKGQYLLPGVIDDHVHFREPSYSRRCNIVHGNAQYQTKCNNIRDP
jgi:dihydroorotase